MMHAVADYGNAGVPAFLQKLWTLVEDESTNDLIAWDASGKSFHVFEQSRFSKEVLPLYFKHNNIASFVRQLNMYGFRKVTNVEHGGLKIERDDMEFIHQYFQQGKEELLEHIKRKVPTGKGDDVKLKTDDVTKVLRDVHGIKGRQENITSKMDALERENEALWREVAGLRQKHHKQQKIVNKLIQFLVTLVGNRGLGAGLKRKMPLMINDASQLENQRPTKMARPFTLDSSAGNSDNIQVIPEVKSPGSVSSFTPQSTVKIEEMVDTAQPQVYTVVSDPATSGANTAPQQRIIVLNKNPQQMSIPQNTVESQPVTYEVVGASTSQPGPAETSPASSSGFQQTQQQLDALNNQQYSLDLGEGLQTSVGSQSGASVSPGPPAPQRTSTAVALPEQPLLDSNHLADVSGHIVSVEDSLDSLKDLLAGNIDPQGMFNLRLDTDTLQGLFTPEAPIPPTPEPYLTAPEGDKPVFPESSDQISGQELIQYNPQEDLGNLFDLDMLGPLPSDTGGDASLEEDEGGLRTPYFDVTSPLAQRRKSKTDRISTDDVD